VSTLEIRPLRPDDDIDVQVGLSERAFGLMSPGARENWRRSKEAIVAAGHALAVFDGGRQAGGAHYLDMRQWWAGREVPMAGVAGVTMAPEARGQGIGRQLMTETLRLIAARGYPLSALYPATMPIYRSLGWELAGRIPRAVVAARSLRSLLPSDSALLTNEPASPPVRQVTPHDAADVIAALGRAYREARDCGPITRDVSSVELGIRDDPDSYRYLCGDEGFLSYRWQPGNGAIFADRMVAATPAALRELLALLAGHSSTADTVTIRTAPDSPLWLLLRERDAEFSHFMWMLRVVDAPAAVAARGFGTGIGGSVLLNVADDVLPGNAGTWRFTVGGGQGILERAEPARGALTVGARGLSALYAGTPVHTLRMAGLAAGGSPDDDAFLTAAFACTCYMLDSF
jgi:predicted acetyltransferase